MERICPAPCMQHQLHYVAPDPAAFALLLTLALVLLSVATLAVKALFLWLTDDLGRPNWWLLAGTTLAEPYTYLGGAVAFEHARRAGLTVGATDGTIELFGMCLVFTLSPALHGMLMHEDTSSSSPPNWCRPALLCTLALPTVLLGLKLWESF